MKRVNSRLVGLLSALFYLTLASSPVSSGAQTQEKKTFVILGDTEGMDDGLQTYIKSGDLKLENGRLEFGKANGFIFLGDLPDRGPASIKLRKLFSEFKDRFPEKVSLIMGNREANKLLLFRELPNLESLKEPGYVSFLEKKYTELNKAPLPTDPKLKKKAIDALNAADSQVDYFLKQKGAWEGLEFHRKELEATRGSSVTLKEAAQDYINGLKPGGEHFEYIKRTELMRIKPDEDFAAVHGGITEHNLGQVPGRTTVVEDPNQWAKELNLWKDQEIAAYERAFKSGSRGDQLPGTLADFGEAIWDPEVINFQTGKKGMLTFNDRSPVYPYRSKVGDNFRPPSEKVSESLRKYQKSVIYNGHSPSPNGPTITNDGHLLNVMADTSMTTKGNGVLVRHTVGEGVYTKWATGDGTQVEFRLKAGQATEIGKVTSDGYIINGLTPDGKAVLSKYSDEKRFVIQEKVVPAQDLQGMNAAFRKGAQVDADAASYLANTQRALREQKGVRFFTEADASKMIGKKKVIALTSASKLGRLPTSEAELEKFAKKIVPYYVEKYGADNLVVLWGGTDVSKGEYHLVKEFQKLGVSEIGFTNQAVKFSEVGITRNIVVAGAHEDWTTAIKTMVSLTKEKGGELIAMGGGPVVKEVLDDAIAKGVTVHAMSADPEFLKTGEGFTGGASAEFAQKNRQLSFSNADDLMAKVEAKRAVPKIGVFTGSFDPPHAGHKAIIDGMAKEYGLDVVYVIPDKNVKYKPGMMSFEHREAMVKKMLEGSPHARVLPADLAAKIKGDELWDVYRGIQGAHPGAQVSGIMGTDTLLWYMKLPADKHVSGIQLLVNERDAKVEMPTHVGDSPVSRSKFDTGLSSTELRKKIADGTIADELSPQVKAYIAENKLYGQSKEALNGLTDYTKQSTSTLDEIRQFYKDRGKKVVTLVGYSGAEYQDKSGMLKKVREIFGGLDPKKTIINIGGTVDGLGIAYEVAKEMGFETTGIVSVKAKEYPSFSKHVDRMFLVEDQTWGGYLPDSDKLAPTSQAMVENSDRLIALGGNQVAADESRAAIKTGKEFEFHPFDFNHDKAIKKAEKAKQPVPTDFRGAAHEALQTTNSKTAVVVPAVKAPTTVDTLEVRKEAAALRVQVLDPTCVENIIKGAIK